MVCTLLQIKKLNGLIMMMIKLWNIYTELISYTLF